MSLPFRLSILLALASSLPTPAAAADTMLQGIALPDAVHVASWDTYLRHAGAAIVYRRYLPFQVVALYVDRGSIDADALQRAMAPCRLEIHWLTPAIAPADAQAFWLQQLGASITDPAIRAGLEPQMKRVADALGVGERGDVTVVEYHPDRGLAISAPGRSPARFAGLELTRAVLAVWLGAGAERDIRDGLLGRAPLVKPAATPSTR
jgi:hypothetical protein